MAIRTVTSAGIKKDASSGSFKKTDCFTADFRMLNLNKPGNSFKLRILPPNNDEATFKEPYDGFAYTLPSHYGVGDNGKEMCICTNRHAPRYMVKCPMCAEFSEGKTTKRSKLSFYYYMNVVLLSKHDGYDRVNPDGSWIVYTVRIPKVQVFDIIANYCEAPDRAIKDPFSLEHGCAITISVTEKKVGADKYPQYNVQFNEASIGNITSKVKESDIKDLRLIGRYIPTNTAMRNIADGMPVSEAMSVFGKIDITTGKQIGGSTEAPANDAAKDKKIMDDLSDDLELDGDGVKPSAATEDLELEDADLGGVSDDNDDLPI